MTPGLNVIEELSSVLDLVAERAEAADATRQPDPEVIRLIAELGLLRLVVPSDYGGHGVEPEVFMAFTERLARVHGSTAWTTMTCNEEAGIAAAYLRAEPLTAL